MTMTGALVGSPAHMAPEIIEGEEAGAEADVFSLGTMLYLFATGKLPFVAPNTTATLKRILDCVYDDPRQVVPTVSDELAEIIGSCLQRQPGNRFSTATKLRDALAEYLATVGLTRPHEELAKFFLDPRGYRKELTPRITSALLAQAEKSIAEKKSARAMSALNQVLAHEPSNSRANELLGQMRARKQREVRVKRLQKMAFGGGIAFIVAMSAIQGVRVAMRPVPFVPHYALSPTDVTLASVAWPKAIEPEKAPDPAVITKVEPPEVLKPVLLQVPNKLSPRPPADLLDVAVIVRPFGYVQVDDGPRSTDALARHNLKLAPGSHKFTVTCDLCETQGRSVTMDIKKGEDVPLVAPLKPSLVSFQGWPDDAKIRVGATEKTVKESQGTPFRIVTPASGNPEMRHKVEYSVSLGGQIVDQGVKFAVPGQPKVIERGAP
jgi:serine/threonine-protein kinase